MQLFTLSFSIHEQYLRPGNFMLRKPRKFQYWAKSLSYKKRVSFLSITHSCAAKDILFPINTNASRLCDMQFRSPFCSKK